MVLLLSETVNQVKSNFTKVANHMTDRGWQTISLLEIHSLTQTIKFWEITQIGAICDISQTTRNKLLPLCIPHIKQKTQ